MPPGLVPTIIFHSLMSPAPCLQIKDMSDRDLARFWSNYVKEIAVLLVSVEGDPHPPNDIVNRIQELVQKELLFLYIR